MFRDEYIVAVSICGVSWMPAADAAALVAQSLMSRSRDLLHSPNVPPMIGVMLPVWKECNAV